MYKRQDLEQREYLLLDPRASHARDSAGRQVMEEPCEFRTDYQRDRDRILHSKSFRRLMHKTQVFLSLEGDHYRTRLTHTLEVSQVSRTVARSLNYNEDLTEAIALGHDLGHTPFGHSGERVLNRIHPGGFRHNEQSLRIVDRLEETPRRTGLNLTEEVRDGILHHTGRELPVTLEGQIVRICDRIAYVNHDIDDAIRSGILQQDELPREELRILGETHTERINNLIVDLISSSEGQERILLSDPYRHALDSLRSFLFRKVYRGETIRIIEERNQVERVVSDLYHYYLEHSSEMPELYLKVLEEDGTAIAVKDYVSGMTDRYAVWLHRELFTPGGIHVDRQQLY